MEEAALVSGIRRNSTDRRTTRVDRTWEGLRASHWSREVQIMKWTWQAHIAKRTLDTKIAKWAWEAQIDLGDSDRLME